LIRPDGGLGMMLGNPPSLDNGEWWNVPDKEVPTACVCFNKTMCPRFDEGYIGSGWEDTDFMTEIRTKQPNARFIIRGDVRLVHLNEMKKQGENYNRNKELYENKWLKTNNKSKPEFPKITGIIHVGACRLEEKEYYNKQLKTENIIWIEANTDLCLEQKNKNQNDRIYNYAICDVSDKEISLHVSNNEQSSSILDFKYHKEMYCNLQRL
jgi:hypothetical protein